MSFPKLEQMSWTCCRSKTLLHFVAREVAKNAAGGSVACKASLPNCAAAVRLALPATRAELADLDRSLRDSVAVADAIPATETQSAAFRQVENLMSHSVLLGKYPVSTGEWHVPNLYRRMSSSLLSVSGNSSMSI